MEDKYKKITIRDIPENTLLILKDNAKKQGRSLNQYMLDIFQNIVITNEFNTMKNEFKRLFDLTLARLDNNTIMLEKCEQVIDQNTIIMSEIIDNGEKN